MAHLIDRTLIEPKCSLTLIVGTHPDPQKARHRVKWGSAVAGAQRILIILLDHDYCFL